MVMMRYCDDDGRPDLEVGAQRAPRPLVFRYFYLSVVFQNKYQSYKYERNTAGKSAKPPPPLANFFILFIKQTEDLRPPEWVLNLQV